MNRQKVQLILKRLELQPKKRLGQNFLIDKNIAQKIIFESELSNNDTILEIGPGLGALTEILVEKTKKVYAIEIEPKFCEYLSKRFANHNNIEIIEGDILKIQIPRCNKVVANIPFSITGPILEKVFFKPNPPQGIVTIERNIANRIFFERHYKNFSRITVTFNSFMEPVRKYSISRNSFYPTPKIDLALIKVIPKEIINQFLKNAENINYFLKFVAGIMPYKNKNVANALKLHLKIDKEDILHILNDNNFDNNKLFSLRIEDFIELSKVFLDSEKSTKDSD